LYTAFNAFEIENLAPDQFVLWTPPEARCVHVGEEERPVPLPRIPLPLRVDAENGEDGPDDNAIGEGLHDYLRRFPDCRHNLAYAGILRDAFSHYLADMAAHAVMLDVKEVEPAYVVRKLTSLKIFCLLEPANVGLLRQLCRGFYELALTFSELHDVRRNLLEAMRYGQQLLRCSEGDVAGLAIMAEIDLLFGDYPTALSRLQHLLDGDLDEAHSAGFRARYEACLAVGMPDHPLVDDLERIATAMSACAVGNVAFATDLLEQLSNDAYFKAELETADFQCLLGICRKATGDTPGARAALTRALELSAGHERAQAELADL
jgi:hypothetical protein